MSEQPVDCFNTLNQICEILGEDINGTLCLEVQEHLRHCPKCCAHVDSIRKVVNLYKKATREDIPQKIDERLWKVLNLQKPCD